MPKTYFEVSSNENREADQRGGTKFTSTSSNFENLLTSARSLIKEIKHGSTKS